MAKPCLALKAVNGGQERTGRVTTVRRSSVPLEQLKLTKRRSRSGAEACLRHSGEGRAMVCLLWVFTIAALRAQPKAR